MISFRKHIWTIVLWLAAALCLLPFVTLSFFSVPSSDDYGLFLRYRQYGFWETQHLVYTQWTGRFVSTFIGSLFFVPGLPDGYYFLHTLLLLAGTWAALYFLLAVVNRRWLGGAFRKSRLALASLILLLLTIYAQAEISTGFYWLSSTVTYQTAFVFFILLAGCLIRRLHDGGREGAVHGARRRKWQDDILIVLLILCIAGSNETAAVFLFFLLLGLAGMFYVYKLKAPAALLLYVVVTLAAGGLILLSSGILSYRSSMINHHPRGLVVILPMILFRFASVFYFIMKVPLFWLAAFVLYLLGTRVSAKLPAAAGATIASLKGRKVVVPGLATLSAVLFLSLAAILVVSKGSLPERALNNLIDLVAILLLGLAFVAGAAGIAREAGITAPITAALLVCGLFASDSLLQAWKSNLSGYFYHSVMEDRHARLQKASKDGQKTVTLEGYDQALEDKIRKEFPQGLFRSIDPVFRERPPLLFLGDAGKPGEVDPGWRYYYRLDSIRMSPGRSPAIP